MAVPKRKTSKQRRNKRRTHFKISAPNFASCPQCGEPKLQHRVCRSCGYYKNKQVIEIAQ